MAGNTVKFVAQLQDNVSSGLAKIRDNFDRLGNNKGAQSLLQGVGVAAGINAYNLLGNAVSNVEGYVFDSIQAASDFNETIQKSGVVFGASEKDIESWGKTAATSMGLSENAAIGAAASIGNLLRSTGTAPDQIAPMSEALVKLASDLASFNNISVEDALAKIQSGLVGQERPLRELGVAISAASVDAEAAALGFQKVNGVFTEGQKVQARYALIFAQTKTAQGDFARTSDQLANAQRTLNAEFQDIQVEVGQELLPIMRSLADTLKNDVLPVVKDQVNPAFHELSNVFHDVINLGNATKTGMDAQSAAARDQAAAQNEALQAWNASLDTEKAATALEISNTEAVVDGTKALNEQADAIDATTRARISASESLDTWASKFGRLQDAAGRAGDALKDFYGLQSAAGRHRELTDQLQSDEAALRKVQKAHRDGKITMKEYHDQVAILNGKIGDDRQALLDLDVEMAKLGNKKGLIAWIAGQIKNWNKLTEAEKQALVAAENAVNYGGSGPNPGKNKKGPGSNHYASGGVLRAGDSGYVGEEGMERLTALPGGGVVVTPLGASGSGSGSGWGGGVTLIYAPQVSTASPAEAQRFLRSIVPELTKEMRRQHVLPGS